VVRRSFTTPIPGSPLKSEVVVGKEAAPVVLGWLAAAPAW